MPGGIHDIYAVLDPYNKLMELNETDNSLMIRITENVPPIIYELPVIPVLEDVPYDNALQLPTYVWDPDEADELEFRIISKSEPRCNVVIDYNNYIDISSDPDWYGTCNVTIEVSDGINSAVSYLHIQVSPVNDPPVLKPIDNQTTLEDEWFELVLFGYDHSDSGDIIHYETNVYEVFPGLIENESVMFDSRSGKLNLLPNNSMVGEHVIKFRAVDEHGGASEWQEVRLTIVNTQDPPVIKLEPFYKVKAGETFTIQVIVEDEDKNSVFLFSDDTDLFEIDSATGVISFKPDSADAGKHTVTITVSDGEFMVDETIEIEIENGWGNLNMILAAGLGALIVGILVGVLLITLFKRRKKELSDDVGKEEEMKEEEKKEGKGKKGEEDIEPKKPARKRTVKRRDSGSLKKDQPKRRKPGKPKKPPEDTTEILEAEVVDIEDELEIDLD
jgi:hypothetical protein